MNFAYFDKYLEEDVEMNNCISNHKNKTMVFKEKVENEIYFIKKYIPYGKRKIRIAFKLLEDRSIHYKKIAEKLEKLKIPYIGLEYNKIKKLNFLERRSIIVTKYGGEVLETYLKKDFQSSKKFINLYYDFFIKLVKNGIYPIDYNTGGMLIDKNGEVKLTDFDDYRLSIFLNKKLKNRLIRNLRRIYLEENRSQECKSYLENEINRVLKELKWEKS